MTINDERKACSVKRYTIVKNRWASLDGFTFSYGWHINTLTCSCSPETPRKLKQSPHSVTPSLLPPQTAYLYCATGEICPVIDRDSLLLCHQLELPMKYKIRKVSLNWILVLLKPFQPLNSHQTNIKNTDCSKHQAPCMGTFSSLWEN